MIEAKSADSILNQRSLLKENGAGEEILLGGDFLCYATSLVFGCCIGVRGYWVAIGMSGMLGKNSLAGDTGFHMLSSLSGFPSLRAARRPCNLLK